MIWFLSILQVLTLNTKRLDSYFFGISNKKLHKTMKFNNYYTFDFLPKKDNFQIKSSKDIFKLDPDQHFEFLKSYLTSSTNSSYINAIIITLSSSRDPKIWNFLLNHMDQYIKTLTTSSYYIDNLAFNAFLLNNKTIKKKLFSYIWEYLIEKYPIFSTIPFKNKEQLDGILINNFIKKNKQISYISYQNLSAKNKQKVCNLILNNLQLNSSFKLVFNHNNYNTLKIMSSCLNIYKNSKYISLLGLTKNNRNMQFNTLFLNSFYKLQHTLPAFWYTPFSVLLRDLNVNTGIWSLDTHYHPLYYKKILVSTLAKISNKKAIDLAVQNFSSGSIWLKKDLLHSLSLAALPYSGIKLLELAHQDYGDEATYFFLPFMRNCKVEQCKTIKTNMINFLLQLLSVKDANYVYVALFVLANMPLSHKYEQFWYPIAYKKFLKFKKERKYKDASKMLLLLGNTPKSHSLILRLINYVQSSTIRTTAIYELSKSVKTSDIKQLIPLVSSPDKNIALNAVYTISKAKNSATTLENLLFKINDLEIKHQILLMLLQKSRVSPTPQHYCYTMAKFYQIKSNQSIGSSALIYLMNFCSNFLNKHTSYNVFKNGNPEKSTFTPFLGRLIRTKEFYRIKYYALNKKRKMFWALKKFFRNSSNPLIRLYLIPNTVSVVIPLYYKGFTDIRDILPTLKL